MRFNTIYDFERIELSNRTEGEELFVRVWAWSNDEFGTFEICAIDPEPLSISNAVISDFKMYPNPTNNFCFIDCEKPIKSITLFDFEGRLITTIEEQTIDLRNYKSGIYFISLNIENRRNFFL